MGKEITVVEDKLLVPNDPIIPFIEGDGIGPDIWKTTKLIIDQSVDRAFDGSKKIVWTELLAGEKAFNQTGEWLPNRTVDSISKYLVAIKGPLTTPVGKGIRSLNVTLRQVLDLYACVRPCRYISGVPSPVKEPQSLDVVIFRENTEDVYAGVEWASGSREANELIDFANSRSDQQIRRNSGIGIKPISKFGTSRLVRMAIQFAQEHSKNRVTIVHKGNIQKFTEGAFRDWGYDVAFQEYRDYCIDEDSLWEAYDGKIPAGKIVVNDRIADAMFQQILLRPREYQVIALPNLNGDYLSDACAAQVGGLGMAPGANLGKKVALFEATHGTAPKYAGKDKVNPGSLILSAVMMLEHIGWSKPAKLIRRALESTIAQKRVTYDLARQMEGAVTLKTSEFGAAIIENM